MLFTKVSEFREWAKTYKEDPGIMLTIHPEEDWDVIIWRISEVKKLGIQPIYCWAWSGEPYGGFLPDKLDQLGYYVDYLLLVDIQESYTVVNSLDFTLLEESGYNDKDKTVLKKGCYLFDSVVKDFFGGSFELSYIAGFMMDSILMPYYMDLSSKLLMPQRNTRAICNVMRDEYGLPRNKENRRQIREIKQTAPNYLDEVEVLHKKAVEVVAGKELNLQYFRIKPRGTIYYDGHHLTPNLKKLHEIFFEATSWPYGRVVIRDIVEEFK